MAYTAGQNNVRYNIRIISEIVEVLNKKKSFKTLSENVRDRYMKEGQCEDSKIDRICEATGISRMCLTGEKRFIISECETVIGQNPKFLDDFNFIGISNLMGSINSAVQAFLRGELAEDENLERIIHYINNNESMKGYAGVKVDLAKIIRMMEHVDLDRLMKSNEQAVEEFIKVSSEKIILAKAALITRGKGIVN